MGETISQWSGCRLELPDKKFRPRCNLETFSQRNFPSAGRPRLQAHMGTSVVGRVGFERTMFGDAPSLVPDDSNIDRLWKESYSVIRQMMRQCGGEFACAESTCRRSRSTWLALFSRHRLKESRRRLRPPPRLAPQRQIRHR